MVEEFSLEDGYTAFVYGGEILKQSEKHLGRSVLVSLSVCQELPLNSAVLY